MSTTQNMIISIFLISAFLIFLVRVRALRAEQRTRFEAGIPAIAMVIEAKTLEHRKDNPQTPTVLHFWVEPPAGLPFKTHALWLIDSDHLSAVRPGQSFPVRIDTLTNEVIFPNVDWAKYDWLREHEAAKIQGDTQPI